MTHDDRMNRHDRRLAPDSTDAGDDDRVDAEAAEWLIRFEGGSTDSTVLSEFDKWIRLDARHAEAFRRAQATWAILGEVSGDPDANADYPIAVSRSRDERLRTRARRAWPAAVALAACFLVAIGAVWKIGNPLVMFQADHRTAIGEVRRVDLSDGSTVYLNTNSAITVHFQRGGRMVSLLSGEAVFDLAPVSEENPERFNVVAGPVRVEALGTRYSVRLDGARSDVSVLEHRVAVTTSDGASRNVLKFGERIVGWKSGVSKRSASSPVNPEWMDGRVVYRDVPASALVADLNRYLPDDVVILEPALAQRRVSASFRLDRIHEAPAALSNVLKAESISVPLLGTVLY